MFNMVMRMIRWLGKNISSLLLAFVFAFIVWVSAILAADPNEVQIYPRLVNIAVVGLDSQLIIVDDTSYQARITIRAPRSIWSKLNSNPELVKAWIDLAGVKEGNHAIPVKVQIAVNPTQVIKIEPDEINLTLEKLINKTYPVEVIVSGEPALGYRQGVSSISPTLVNVSGAESQVKKVSRVTAQLDVSSASESIKKNIPVEAVDANGDIVPDIEVSPSTVLVTQQISLLGGYRNVVVKVVTTGEVASGYWLTNISVSPPNVTVFSADPQLVDEIPGFVETKPVDLTGLSDDTDILATLDLPPDVSLAGEESVLIRLSIAALEGSLPVSLPVQAIGLSPELFAQISPESVDVLISGPLPLINSLTSGGIRVSVDLTGMEPGTYQVVPKVDLLPSQLKVASINPQNLEVTIVIAPTATRRINPTVTLTPILPTPTATPGETKPINEP